MTVYLQDIKHRAKRLNQPEMIQRYLDRSTTTTDTSLTLTDEAHTALNAMWDESRKPRQSLAATVRQGKRKPSGCSKCGKKKEINMETAKKWYNMAEQFEQECDPVELDLAKSILRNHALDECGKKLRIGRLILQWMIREDKCPDSGEGGPFEDGERRENLLAKARDLLARSQTCPHAKPLSDVMTKVLKGEFNYVTGNRHLERECLKFEKWLRLTGNAGN